MQDQIQIEPEFQLANDDDWGRIAAERHKVTAANLTLRVKTQVFEKTFDRTIQRRFQDPQSLLARWLPTVLALPERNIQRSDWDTRPS